MTVFINAITSAMSLFIVFLLLMLSSSVDANPSSCVCKVCGRINRFQEVTAAPRKHMYTNGMNDGIGDLISHIIFAGGIANGLGFEFGGAFAGSEKALRRHGASSAEVLDFVFGNHEQIRPKNPPAWHKNMSQGIHTLKMYEKVPWNQEPEGPVGMIVEDWLDKLPKPAVGYYFEAIQYDMKPQYMDYFLTQSYLAKLRSTSDCAMGIVRTPRMNGGKRVLSVVAHFRLGDIDSRVYAKSAFAISLSPQENYFKLFSAFKTLFKKHEVVCTAYTSCVSLEHCRMLHETDIPLWKSHGITLNVDFEKKEDPKEVTEEVKRALKDMVSADILITAKSSFSYVAAMLNPNCVINHRQVVHSPMSNWILANDGKDKEYALIGQNNSLPIEIQLKRALTTSQCGGLSSLF